MRWSATSSGSPTTTRARAGSPRGSPPPAPPVDLDQVETNFVQLDVGPDRAAALDALRAEGVLLSGTIHRNVLRAVTYLGITDDDIEQAIELIPRALEARVGA